MPEDMSNSIKRTQEQAVASWIGYLYNLRINRVRERFSAQEFNLSAALKELNELKLFVADKNHILGNLSSKHGEIAEHCQVNISNARRLVEGLTPEYSFENVGRTAPVDYLKNGIFIQSKFYNGTKGTIKAIIKHIKTYPDYIQNGGKYEIASDQYEEIKKCLDLYNRGKRSSLSKEDLSLLNSVWKMQSDTGVEFEKDIYSSVVSYKDVQVNAIDSTINREEESIYKTDDQQRKDILETNKPTKQEILDVTIKSALIEGSVSFLMAYIKKRKSGKKITQFSGEDWIELGVQFGEGTLKGGVRGATLFVFAHYTSTPACIASAYVTAAFGICETLKQFREGSIDTETFIITCEALSLEVSISALASLAGQVLIPIPILGAIIGNVSGEVIYGICKDKCSEKEIQLIRKHNDKILINQERLDKEYSYCVRVIESELSQYKIVEELAFSEEANLACINSIRLAEMVGVSKELIIHSEDDLGHFLLD